MRPCRHLPQSTLAARANAPMPPCNNRYQVPPLATCHTAPFVRFNRSPSLTFWLMPRAWAWHLVRGSGAPAKIAWQKAASHRGAPGWRCPRRCAPRRGGSSRARCPGSPAGRPASWPCSRGCSTPCLCPAPSCTGHPPPGHPCALEADGLARSPGADQERLAQALTPSF